MELTKEDIKTILVLLSRTDIKGSEAQGFLMLVQKLNQCLKPDEKEK